MKMIDGRYRILQPAGSGGFGTLYRGYDMRLKRNVAIKTESDMNDSEAMILRQLDHKGLPRIYDVCMYEGHLCLIMEWVPGTNLEDYLEHNGPMEEQQALRIGTELLEVLTYLHGQKEPIVYQDLKPANIMLMPDGHIKLVDFGTAFTDRFDDTVKIYAGTAGYAAPEQRGLLGLRFADERSDIYSWGACMYSLVSGKSLNKPPYTMTRPRQACPQLSYGLERIILKAVERNPGKRYGNVSELQQALKSIRATDLVYRGLFAAAVAAAFAPLAIFGAVGLKSGVFAGMEKVFMAALEAGCSVGDSQLPAIFSSRFWNFFLDGGNWLRYGGFTDTLCKVSGLMAISAAWLFGILHMLTLGRTARVRRSVFLSEKRYPGLWLCILLAGVIFGFSINGSMAGASVMAAERGEVLPVNIVEENGMRTVVRSDAEITADGNIVLEIPERALAGEGEKKLSLQLIKEDGSVESRTFVMH